MAGIYIHIPYCRQACYYCDFHFSTNINTKSELISAILKEIEIQRHFFNGSPIDTIYFGGGTPSLLTKDDLHSILEKVNSIYPIKDTPEVTIEANPDDLNLKKLNDLKALGFNKLSIGIQSFNNEILKSFNRAHNSFMAVESVKNAQKIGFENISIDLIFGVPDQSTSDLKSDLKKSLALNTQHISIYGLTIEENTVFGKWEKQNKLKPLDEEIAAEHLELIMKELQFSGYSQYEISNFCKAGFKSKHNSSYWNGERYLGLGPAAHSYDGKNRFFNISNNIKYIKSLKNEELPREIEILTPQDRINEFILTQIRLIDGINVEKLKKDFDCDLIDQKNSVICELEKTGFLKKSGNHLKLSDKGKLLADYITEKLIF